MMKRKSIWLCAGLALAAAALGVTICHLHNTVKVVFACSRYKPELSRRRDVFRDVFQDARHALDVHRLQAESNIMAVAIQRQVDAKLVEKALSKLKVRAIDEKRSIFQLKASGRRDIAEFVASEYLNAIDKAITDNLQSELLESLCGSLYSASRGECQSFLIKQSLGRKPDAEATRRCIGEEEARAGKYKSYFLTERAIKMRLVDCPDSVARNVHFTEMRLPPPISGLELAAAAGVDTNRVSSQCIDWKCPQSADINGKAMELRSFQISTNRCYVSFGAMLKNQWWIYGDTVVEVCASEVDAIDRVFSRIADLNLITAEGWQRFCKELSIQRDGEMLIILVSKQCYRDMTYLVYKNVFCEFHTRAANGVQIRKSILSGGEKFGIISGMGETWRDKAGTSKRRGERLAAKARVTMASYQQNLAVGSDLMKVIGGRARCPHRAATSH